jgi:hypothetical protein
MLPSILTSNYFDQSVFPCFLQMNKLILLPMVYINDSKRKNHIPNISPQAKVGVQKCHSYG